LKGKRRALCDEARVGEGESRHTPMKHSVNLRQEALRFALGFALLGGALIGTSGAPVLAQPAPSAPAADGGAPSDNGDLRPLPNTPRVGRNGRLKGGRKGGKRHHKRHHRGRHHKGMNPNGAMDGGAMGGPGAGGPDAPPRP